MCNIDSRDFMTGERPVDGTTTNPSIFVRLNRADPEPREIAWRQFNDRYAPIIAGFARRLGARSHEVDDVVQDVLVSFYSKSPTFVYDPSKGRFRGYLKVCTLRALTKRLRRQLKLKTVPIDKISEDAVEIEQVWNDVWERQQLERAMAIVREQHTTGKSWRAFELHVVQGQLPQEVAKELGLSLSAVYKAKERIGGALRERIRALEKEER